MNNNKLSQRLNSFPKDHQLNQDTKEKIEHVLQAKVRREEKKVKWKGLKGFIKKTKIPVAVTTAAILFSFLLLTVKSFDFNKNPVNDPDTELPAEQPEKDKSEEDKDQDKPKEKKEQVSPQVEAIAKKLSSFKLPKENRITGKEREKLVEGAPTPSNIIVYENGFKIDKSNKQVTALIHFKDGENIEVPQGTQALALFKTLVNTRLREHASLIRRDNMSEEPNFEITDKVREKMKGSNGTGTGMAMSGTWDSVQADIDKKLKEINEIEDHLKEYDKVYEWTQEAKSYFVKAKEIGREDWEKSYKQYVKGARFIDELRKAIQK